MTALPEAPKKPLPSHAPPLPLPAILLAVLSFMDFIVLGPIALFLLFMAGVAVVGAQEIGGGGADLVVSPGTKVVKEILDNGGTILSNEIMINESKNRIVRIKYVNPDGSKGSTDVPMTKTEGNMVRFFGTAIAGGVVLFVLAIIALPLVKLICAIGLLCKKNWARIGLVVIFPIQSVLLVIVLRVSVGTLVFLIAFIEMALIAMALYLMSPAVKAACVSTPRGQGAGNEPS